MNVASSQSNDLKIVDTETERFLLAVQGVNDGLWDWDLLTDEVFYSPEWKMMLGYEDHELDSHFDTWRMLVDPADKDKVLQEVQKFVSGELEHFAVEMKMLHKKGHHIHVLSRGLLVKRKSDGVPIRIVGTHVDITERNKEKAYNERNAEILKMIAIGSPAAEVYDAIALMYEDRHPGLRCSMLELHGNKLLHGGAPSLPKAYCEAVHGLEYGPDVGSCGTSTYTGKRVIVENIETDPKWTKIKHAALPHGMRCCWSEPIKNSSGKVLGAFGMYFDYPATPNEEQSKDLKSAAMLAGIVMERDQSNKKIRKLAFEDELTGLPSRASFYQNLEKIIAKSQPSNVQFGLLIIDLDNFKQINDSLGHDAGDHFLKIIAERLQQASDDIKCIGRLGGDEFCILSKSSQENSIEQLAEKCIEVVSQPVELMARRVKPTCSIGVAKYPVDGQNISGLFKAADVSLYKAKESGKNQFVFYSPKLTEEVQYQFKLEQALKVAIEKNQFRLVYQPKINLETGRIAGVEALCRWYHPDLKEVEPVNFIAAAERTGMIKPLTEWVLSKACQQAVEWQQQGFKGLCMAVNISPSHFSDKAIVPLVKKIIAESGIDPEILELEVIESVVQIDDSNLTIFDELKTLGIKLAVDDFGSRYSYFATLKHLDVDMLKIDKYFIDDIATDEKGLVLFKSMLAMGKNLGYEIIIEGVETTEQYKIIKKLGCQFAQGFLFSKPVEASKISQLLSLKVNQATGCLG